MHTDPIFLAFCQGYDASARSDTPANPYWADTDADRYGAFVDGIDAQRKDARDAQAGRYAP